MPFVEQEAGQTTETTIDGRKVPVIKPKVIVTLTHKETGIWSWTGDDYSLIEIANKLKDAVNGECLIYNRQGICGLHK